ncbi:MAG: NOB1 family endonuclease [Candidatus Poseidoniales archaeon]
MFILDTCAFLTQKHPTGEFVTVPGIKTEIVNRQSRQYFENMLATHLKVMKAQKNSYDVVNKEAKETGDYDVLSKVDVDILALGYECKGTIITDDFAIQNVALALDVKFLSCSGKIISERRAWRYKCTACSHKEKVKLKNCSVCGNEEIRRIKLK